MKAANTMTEPASSAVAGIAAWKLGLLGKLGALLGAGGIGALLIAAVDPAEAVADRKQRRRLIFTQVIVAGVMASMCTSAVVRWLASWNPWMQMATFEDWGEVALPVGLFIGALSWGVLGALVKLRALVKERGAEAVAARIHLVEPAAPKDPS